MLGKLARSLCPEKDRRIPRPIFNFEGAGGVADVEPARRTIPWVNLRRVLRVGFWNVLSLSENQRLPQLLDELSRLRVDMVGLSETRRTGSDETSSKGFTYYWSGMSNCHYVKGVAIGVSSRLQPSVVEVTLDIEHIMRLRLKHSLHFMSVVAVYTPTEVSETEEKEMFYAKLDSVLCPCHDALIILGDFNAVTGTERASFELYIGPNGSGTRNDNSSFLLNLARSRGLRIAGSWYQSPALHHWTWCSNAGGVVKEIDHILVSTRWRILQNYRVFRSADFFATDHKLVVATLKLHVKSRKPLRRECSDSLQSVWRLDTIENPVELWETFKRETFEAAKECVGERSRSHRGLASVETLDSIEESRAARLADNRNQYRVLSLGTRALLRRDKERLEALHEEAKSLGLQVSWPKTKVQMFRGLLHETVQSVRACGEDIEILENFTYLGCVMRNDGGSSHEVLTASRVFNLTVSVLRLRLWSSYDQPDYFMELS
ncbi:uncharacterized protein LOC123503949 [Portunus trituberculatus]|uniref:uncharacterized protein LOC123503949 n=1 Tax=Portunus trituberculatus TaxID=210409 RepID=UPI001E1D08FA|nr:uncharacterized protein LOC123503949 [Portunus trituberculatus]